MSWGKFGISKHPLRPIFDRHLQALSPTLGSSALGRYEFVVRRFLTYLHHAFPHIRRLSQLRRDPHLIGFCRLLCEEKPPLSNTTRARHLIELRRLFHDMATNGHPIQPDLIRREDIPPRIRLLPRALPPEEDRLLTQELERTGDLHCTALLLIRATGIRVGECIDLGVDCLRQIGPDQWGLHVPVGKLYTERLVPADANIRSLVDRILALRASCSPAHLARSQGLLLPRWGRSRPLYHPLANALADAANRACCSMHVTPHQLRHTFASDMIRLGVSLPAVMQLLGHTHIGMTMRYVQVTQQDLQREFLTARQNALDRHSTPQLSLPPARLSTSDLPAVHHALAATRHMLEMYRRKLPDEKTRRKLQRLDKRLRAVAAELDRFATPEE